MKNSQGLDINKIAELQFAFGQIYDENFKPRDKTIYSKEIKNFNEKLNEVGIDSKLTPKQIELKLQQLYEILIKVPKFADQTPNDKIKETPKPEAQTANTVSEKGNEQIFRDLEKRNEELRKTREEAKRVVQNAKTRQEEIYKEKEKLRASEIENEQRQIKNDIQEAESAQHELESKRIYAKITIPTIPELTPEEKQDLQILEDFAKDPETRTQLIEDLTHEIEERIEPTLKDATENEIKIIARTSAVDIVEKIANPEARQKAQEENIQTAVYQSLATNPKVIKEVVKEAKPLQTLEKGSVVLAYYANEQNATTQIIAGKLFDSKFKQIFYGPDYKEIRIEYTEKPIQGQTNYTVDIGVVNREFIGIQQKQNALLEEFKSLGIEKTQTYFSNQAGLYIQKTIDKLPAKSVIKQVYSNPVLQRFLSQKSQPIVLEFVGQNRVAGVLSKYIPQPVLSIAGKALGIEIKNAVATKVAGQVATQVAVKAGATATVSATLAALGASAPVPVLNVILAAFGYLVGEIWSKFKVWWSKNKENIAPFLAVGAGLSLARFGIGPAILGGAGTFLMFGGTASALLFGPLRFFAILGRNIGITIATPVIVTLLIIPPLVAFIMLVINNSAYVVPPSLNSLSKTMDLITIPPGGNLKKCDPNETGEDITEQLASSITAAGVYLLPDWIPSRRQGICMTPTMIILHTSGGYDNDNGNSATYETIVAAANTEYPTSAHLATDTDNTIFMLSFFENEVEFGWHANNLNEGGIGIEMAGEYQGSHGPHSKCSPEGSLTYTPNGPHPCPPLEDLAFDAVCKVMQKYSIPWSQVYQHEQSSGTHIDPVGDAWSDKFILRIRDNCPIKALDNLR